MKRPTVGQARAICGSLHEAEAVIILAFSPDTINGISYGVHQLRGRQASYTLSWILQALKNDSIPIRQTRHNRPMDPGERIDIVREWAGDIVREAIEDGSYCPSCKVPWADCDCEESLSYVGPDEADG